MIASLCVHCGPDVRVDEDGCCKTCGADAMGMGLDKFLTANVAALTEDLAKYRDLLEARTNERDEARRLLGFYKRLLLGERATSNATQQKLLELLDEATKLGTHMAGLECDSGAERRFAAIRQEVALQ